MEVLIRTHRAARPGGGVILVHEYSQFVDHSLRRTGADWVPGPKHFALDSGEPVRMLDEGIFQVVSTGEVLRLIPTESTKR